MKTFALALIAAAVAAEPKQDAPVDCKATPEEWECLTNKQLAAKQAEAMAEKAALYHDGKVQRLKWDSDYEASMFTRCYYSKSYCDLVIKQQVNVKQTEDNVKNGEYMAVTQWIPNRQAGGNTYKNESIWTVTSWFSSSKCAHTGFGQTVSKNAAGENVYDNIWFNGPSEDQKDLDSTTAGPHINAGVLQCEVEQRRNKKFIPIEDSYWVSMQNEISMTEENNVAIGDMFQIRVKATGRTMTDNGPGAWGSWETGVKMVEILSGATTLAAGAIALTAALTF